MMSSLGGRLISGRFRLLARSRFQSRRSRSMLSLAHRLAVDVRCRRRLVGRVVCLAMLHVLDARAVDVNVSPLSLHQDFQVPFQGFSILFMWPCCMHVFDARAVDDCRMSIHALSCAIVSASSAMLNRGLLVFVDRGLAMLHATDARAVDDSRPLSCCAVICASSAMLARSRVPRSLFCVLACLRTHTLSRHRSHSSVRVLHILSQRCNRVLGRSCRCPCYTCSWSWSILSVFVILVMRHESGQRRNVRASVRN